jgi:PAS domain-containing protein
MDALTRIYRPENRVRCLLAAVALAGIVALVDWRTDPFAQLGFLYLFPVALAAGFLARWQTVLMALVLAAITEAFSSLGSADAIPRTLTESVALAGAGLFVSELVRRRQLALEHVKSLEDQIRLRREAEEQFHILVGTSPAAILILDRQGQILQANESAQRLLAVRSEPLAGVYKIRCGKGSKYRNSSGLRVVGRYVLTGLPQRVTGA